MRLAVIPARGGSKRIPHKNIRSFLGKPIIAYSIETAIQSNLFETIIVSTDSEAIADVALQYGAEVPFMRPSALADDHADTLSVVAHAIEALAAQNLYFSEVCCIYATVPFLQSASLTKGWRALTQQTAIEYAFAACEYRYPIFRSFKITPEHRVEMFFPEYYAKRSQDLPLAYHDAGQFYWARPETFLAKRPVFTSASTPIILPHYLVQDIDNEADWYRAELLFRMLKEASCA